MSRMVETADSMTMSATPAGSSLPIDVAAVDLHLDVHAVVDEQHRARRGRIALEAGELRGRFQRGGVAALQFHRELAGDDAVGRSRRCGCRSPAAPRHRGTPWPWRSPCRRAPCCSPCRSRSDRAGSRRCRRRRHRASPSAHSPRSAHSARWSGARRAAGRRSCRSLRRHWRSRPSASPARAAR